MITNFEEITKKLTKIELNLIPFLVNIFKKHSIKNPIKAPVVLKEVNVYLHKKGIKTKMTQPRLRKCCNYIRANTMIPLIGMAKGYYISFDQEVIKTQIKSLNERADAINNSARGLSGFIKKVK